MIFPALKNHPDTLFPQLGEGLADGPRFAQGGEIVLEVHGDGVMQIVAGECVFHAWSMACRAVRRPSGPSSWRSVSMAWVAN